MEDWEEMVRFAIRLVTHSFEHRSQDIIDQRIMIHNLDHANELLMKAFLIKEGYIVNYIEKSDVKEGVKREDFLSKSKSMDYSDCLKIISKKLHFSLEKQKKIICFHKIRNEIQHRATYLPTNKEDELILAYPCIKELYMLMFGNFMDRFTHLPEM